MSKFAYVIISALLILSAASCGLDTIITLEPPEFVGFSSAVNNFIFRATGEYDSYYFRGFELYYKIYLNTAATDSDLLSLSELQVKGFKRIASHNDRINNISKPLIPIDSANHDDVFTITVDFDGIEPPTLFEPFAVADDSTATPPVSFSVELRRGIADGQIGHEDEFKPFTVFEDGDGDISSEIWNAISTNEDVTIALYALSYGKRDLIIDVYSVAVYLGEIDITLP